MNERQTDWGRGDWMQTYTGIPFYIKDVRLEDIDIRDIAHSLSMQCRYNGHCREFYSVAEHSCHLFDMAAPEDKAWALLHDATEAYLCDIPRPIKHYLNNYKEIENNLMEIIAKKFGLKGQMPATVHILDNGILQDEMEQNMRPGRFVWNFPAPKLGVKLRYWLPEQAEWQFIERFVRLYPQGLVYDI